MSTVRIPGKLQNKANKYEVHINHSLWKKIERTVNEWKRTTRLAPWWVAPRGEVEAYEQEVAYRFRLGEKREWLNGEPLSLTILLINQRHDCDAIKSVGDSLQKSGRIGNDRQFQKITVIHMKGKESAVEIDVEPI